MKATPCPTKSSTTQYKYYRERFYQQYANMVHSKLRLDRIFRPGVSSFPVLDTFPFVLWQPRWVLHTGAHRNADTFFEQLYHSLILYSRHNKIKQSDEAILVSLTLYSIWRYRSEWIYSLADLVRGGRVQCDQSQLVLQVACLLASLQGNQVQARILERSIHQTGDLFEYLLLQISGSVVDLDRQEPSDATKNPEVKKLLWFECILSKDIQTEKILIRKRSKNPPFDEDELLDVYAAFLARGLLFRAQRMLLRHCRHTEPKNYLLYLVLYQYLINAKYLLYVRRMAQLNGFPWRKCWYESLFAICQLDNSQNARELMKQLQGAHQVQNQPADRSSMEMFYEQLQAAQDGVCPPEIAPQQLRDFLSMQCLNQENGPGRVKESFALFESLLPKSTNGRDALNAERLILLFASLEDKFRIYQKKAVVQHIWPVLTSLAGRSMAIRIWMGLVAYQLDYLDIADQLFDKQVLHSAEQMHVQAELALRNQQPHIAEKYYKNIVSRYPDQPASLFNYGLLLEQLNQSEKAQNLYQRVLEIDPAFQAARQRLALSME